MALTDFFFNKLKGKQTKIDDPTKVKTVELGSSGIENYSGYLEEEYLDRLLNPRQLGETYDKIRRQDGSMSKLSKLHKNPILGADWEIQPKQIYAKDADIQKEVDLISHILFDDLDKSWHKKLYEILSVFDFGFSLFEQTFKPVVNHTTFGDYTGIKSLKWLSPRTIERWMLNQDGTLSHIDQYAYGDEGRIVSIPAEFMTLFTINDEGNNFQGISIFRPVYGTWQRKQMYTRRLAVALEAYGKPVPSLELPDTNVSREEIEKAKKFLKDYTSGSDAYLLRPHGWLMELMNSNYNPENLTKAIDFENKDVSFSSMANFAELGKGGGSYALSKDLSKFFLNYLTVYAKMFCETINRSIINKLSLYNFGHETSRVELKCTGISDRVGKETGEIVTDMVEKKLIQPDDKLEEFLRRRLNLPPIDEETIRKAEPEKPQEEKKEEEKEETKEDDEKKNLSEWPVFIQFNEQKLIGKKADELAALSKTLLTETLGKELKTIEKNAKSKRTRFELNFSGSKITEQVIDKVFEIKSEIHAYTVAEYHKRGGTVKFAEKRNSKWDKSTRLRATAMLLAMSSDMEKICFAVFAQRYELGISIAAIIFSIKQAAEKYMKSPSFGATITNGVTSVASLVTKQFKHEVEEKGDPVTSYTFMNPDPVSLICQKLAGKTVKADSGEVERLTPPLHHRCKTSVRINTESTKNNPPDPMARIPLTQKEIDSANLM